VYLQRELYGSTEVTLEPVPPRLETCLHFSFGDPFIVRRADSDTRPVDAVDIVAHQTSRNSELTLTGRVQALGVFFEPAGFTAMFGTPMRDTADQVLEAGSVLGSSIYKLYQLMGEARSFEDRVQIIDRFLLDRLPHIRKRNAFLIASERLFASRGLMRISELAAQTGLSERQFERKFSDEIGCSPKRYARVARFQTALDMKLAWPQRSWLEIAHRLDYHDQMHMVHDFKSLACNSPTGLMAELGEARPIGVVSANKQILQTE
jgi:AraC-like DNA-binding protein